MRRWVVVPVGPEMQRAEPLYRGGGGNGVGRVAAIFGAGVAVHALLIAGIVGIGGFAAPRIAAPMPERVVVRMIDPVVLPPIPEPPRVAAPEPAPAPTTEPRRVARAVEPRELPADPVQQPPVETKAPPRRVVGLSLESTVTAGNGPAFAVGNTRMGETGEKAADPRAVRPTGGAPAAGKGSNQVAEFVPTGGVAVVKPRRLAEPRLDYPAALKAQGIEGDVAVLIHIGADGAVHDVRIVKSSGVEELDAAARAAAERERFSAATRDGAPIEYTLKYTYRFRIVQG
jgi:protein TonB